MSLSYGSLFENWEIGVARKLINDYRRKWKCLEREDFDDLLQECLMHWLEVRSEYNPSREASKKTFMARIIRNRIINIIEKATSEKRKTIYESVSLDESINNDEDAPTLKDQIADRQDDLPQIKAELKIELSRAFQKLTPQQKELCRLLSEEGLSINEACEHFSKHRSNVYRDVFRIREIFENEGLREYLR